MAYASTVTLEEIDVEGTRTWLVEESEIGTADEWSISGLPRMVSITLFNADLTVAGSASTIQPALGYVAGWTLGELGHISQASAADANHQIQTVIRAVLPDGILYGRTIPDTGTGATGRAVTRISIREGHGL